MNRSSAAVLCRMLNILLFAWACVGCAELADEKRVASPPPADARYYHPAEQLGDLFHEVQMQRIFVDGKTFVDAVPRENPGQILQQYYRLRESDAFDLTTFVETHFSLPPDSEPTAKQMYQTQAGVTMEKHIDTLWDHLTRPADTKQPWSTLIPLPHPYVVPGGRFREVYYWDSYFTMRGLAADQRLELIRSMVRNFAHLVDASGHIPNGNRTYYLSRSQPPFFSAMLTLLAEIDGPGAAARYLASLEKEYDFWMHGEPEVRNGKPLARVVRMPDGAVLNRYFDDLDTPRPESYREDVLTASSAPDHEKPEIYRDLRAAAESGWDFSSRWLAGGRLAEIQTTDIVPVDLNSLLYHTEQTLSRLSLQVGRAQRAEHYARRAADRKAAIQTWLWNPAERIFSDYHLIRQQHTNAATLAMAYPLYFRLASDTQARAVADYLESHLLMPGGLVTSLNDTGQQWDYPNGWAPLQWLAVRGLRLYGHERLAADIAGRWLALNRQVFDRTGRMMEKYNVVDMDLPAGGGEYPLQDGFGWTNGVAKALLKEWPELAESTGYAQGCCE